MKSHLHYVYVLLSIFAHSKCENSTESTITGTLPTISTTLECATSNSSCNNSTETAGVSPNIWKLDRKLDSTYYKFSKPHERKSCHCDLQAHFCDINCCCDADCDPEAKKVFSQCEELPNNEQKHNYCNFLQYVYNNRVLEEFDIHQNSLFCIMKTNLPAHYFEQKRQIVANPLSAHEIIAKSVEYKWSNSANETQNANFSTYLPAFGDQLFVLRNHSKPERFELPDNFVSPDCILRKPIRYLNNFHSRCRQTVNNRHLTIQYYSQNISFLLSIHDLNVSLNSYEGCPKNVCIPLDLQVCEHELCTQKLSNNLRTQFNQKSCVNVVTNVKWVFYHNGTRGIRKINLFLTIANFTNSTHVEQQFSVDFFWLNQTNLNYSEYRSGNPGYIIGEPILISAAITVANVTIVPLNNTVNSTKINYWKYLQSNESNYLENFLVFPKNLNGKCTLSNNINQPIEFGYNMLTKCAHIQGSFFNLTIANKKNHSNSMHDSNAYIDKSCRIVQNNILAYWSLAQNLSDFSQSNQTVRRNYTFGHFGNANRSKIEDWEYYLFDIYPEELFNAILGRNIERNRIECQNICVRIKYNIFYERFDDNQNRIAAIYVEFLNSQSIQLEIAENRVFINVAVTSEVMFYDVTAKRNMKYVNPPSLDVKLPHDFFYPFVKLSENQSSCIHTNRFQLLLIVCMQIWIKD